MAPFHQFTIPHNYPQNYLLSIGSAIVYQKHTLLWLFIFGTALGTVLQDINPVIASLWSYFVDAVGCLNVTTFKEKVCCDGLRCMGNRVFVGKWIIGRRRSDNCFREEWGWKWNRFSGLPLLFSEIGVYYRRNNPTIYTEKKKKH